MPVLYLWVWVNLEGLKVWENETGRIVKEEKEHNPHHLTKYAPRKSSVPNYPNITAIF